MVDRLIYIAGPYTGKTRWQVEQNIMYAKIAGADVLTAGAFPIVPHIVFDFLDDEVQYKDFLDACISLMLRCDAAYFIDGWENSNGACAEHRRALLSGLPVFHYRRDVAKWINAQRVEPEAE